MGQKKERRVISAPGIKLRDTTGQQAGPVRCARFVYDYAVQGGAAGAITLDDGDGGVIKLPDNAVILRCHQETITTLSEASGTPTVKLGITGNDDCFATAVNFNHASMVAEAVTARNNELPLKVATSGGVSVLATIASANLDAGKFALHVEYLEGA